MAKIVVANRDIISKGITKGDIGEVIREECIDSDNYLFIKLQKDDRVIGPSCDNCWDYQ